ncbi:MAG: DnaJ domain-containing protein [Cucumibacter sp.]
MNLNSKFFDRIRIRRRDPARRADAPRPKCAWDGCALPGIYKAPRGPRNAGHYLFCLEHVRQYNKDYDYFASMNPEEVEEHILANGTSWSARLDLDSGARRRPEAPRPGGWRPREWSGRLFSDPFNVFARYARAQARNPFRERERRLHEADRHAIEMLGLDGRPDGAQIKSAYKSMVKKHHPDANGGDKGAEERLRNIIAAYTHLKAKGFL